MGEEDYSTSENEWETYCDNWERSFYRRQREEDLQTTKERKENE